MSTKVLGVIGGLGPMATALFQEQVVQMTEAPTEQDHVDMIVYNFPSIPDRTGYILGSNLKSPLPGLLWAGRALARQKVCCIAIPCVTAHCFYEELEEGIGAPIVNAVKDTAGYLRERGVAAAGVMATEGTVFSGLFSRALMAEGIRPVLPGKKGQEQVSHLIYRNIKAGKSPEMDRFDTVDEELRRNGAEVVILGCTELSLIRERENVGKGFLDVTQVLARESILRCGKSVRQEYGELIT